MASSQASPAALVAAAEVYADQVFRRRNILLRQLQLHVNAYSRAEMSKQAGNSAPAFGAAIQRTGTAGGSSMNSGPPGAPAGGAGNALKSSVTRIAQQLRKEGVRLVEAIQLVRGAQSRLKEWQKQQQQLAGHGSGGGSVGGNSTMTVDDLPSSSEIMQAHSSASSAASAAMSITPTIDVDSYLRKMLTDTDMVAKSNDLVSF